MNLYTLKQILHQSQHPSSASMLTEVQQHIDHFVKHEGDPENTRLVEPFALFILLNECCYDIYGRLRRVDEDSFDNFAKRARFYESECLTDEQLKDVYDGLQDIWRDNEREGANGPDGGFWSTEKSLIKGLYDLLLTLEGDESALDLKLHALLASREYDALTSIVKGEQHDKH